MFEAVTVGAVGTVGGAMGTERELSSKVGIRSSNDGMLEGIRSSNDGMLEGTVARGASPGESRDKG